MGSEFGFGLISKVRLDVLDKEMLLFFFINFLSILGIASANTRVFLDAYGHYSIIQVGMYDCTTYVIVYNN